MYSKVEHVQFDNLQLAEYSLRTCNAGCRTLKNVVLFFTIFIVTWRAPVKRAFTQSLRSVNKQKAWRINEQILGGKLWMDCTSLSFFLISIHFNILQPGHPYFFLVYSCLFCIPDELNHDAKISIRGSFTNNYWTKINTATGSSFTDKKNSFWQDMLHMCEQKSVISLWELVHLCDFLSQASFNFPLDCKVWFSLAPDFKWY